MKPSDTLKILGRSVSYFPKMHKITGSTTASILWGQLFYWSDKGSADDGWIYKSAEELTEETGLSYKEQKNARKILVKLGLLHERYQRLDHKMWFQVDFDALDEAIETLHNATFAKVPNVSSGYDQREDGPSDQRAVRSITYNTQKTTNSSAESKQLRNRKAKVLSLWKALSKDKDWMELKEGKALPKLISNLM